MNLDIFLMISGPMIIVVSLIIIIDVFYKYQNEKRKSRQNKMKIRIDECGELEIERGGKMIKQRCPFQQGNSCGNWCPLFNLERNKDKTILKLCNGVSYKVEEVNK